MTSIIIMLLLILAVTTVITRSLTPFNQAEAETIELASRRADLVEAKDFYWFNGDETYFTITGNNSQDTGIIVIVEQDGGAIEVVEQANAMTEHEAITQTIERENPEKTLEARIGMHTGRPVWEVSFRLENGSIGYTMFSLTSGEWIRTIKNI